MTSNEPICVPQSQYLGARSPHEGPQKGQKPQFWAILAHIAQKDLEEFSASGGENIEKILLLQITVKGPPEGLGHSKAQILRSGPPKWARLGPFCG